MALSFPLTRGLVLPLTQALVDPLDIVEAQLVLIDRTAGTNIGNLTGNGNLAATFNGNTNQTAAASSTLSTVTSAFVGKTLAAPRVFGRAVVYGSNDQGFWSSNPATCQLDIYGKNGAAPADATDGTIIGTTGVFTDTANESAGRTINSTDLVNTWDHIWVRVSHGGAAANARVAELVLFAWE